LSDVVNITDKDEFDAFLSMAQVPVVVKFTAPSWCVPCQRLAPHYKNVANVTPSTQTLFVSVDIDNAPWAVVDYGIQGVPTVKFFVNGLPIADLKERTAVKLLDEIKQY
jgi:thioredoxin 1